MGDQQAETKVFVGGIAWETQTAALRDYFNKFGDVVEAVIITDKITGRSKGYGFVTFKEAEAAKKACEDSSPVINGRKGNCNLASIGARRSVAGKISPPATPPPAAVPWYFHAGKPPSSPAIAAFHRHYPVGVLPFYGTAYGYSPSYITPTSMGYRIKQNHSGAAYLASQFSYPASQGGVMAPISMAPIYHQPMYEFQHNHQLPHTTAAGISIPAAHFFQPAAAAVISYGSPAPTAHTKFPVVAPSKC